MQPRINVHTLCVLLHTSIRADSRDKMSEVHTLLHSVYLLLGAIHADWDSPLMEYEVRWSEEE